MQNLGQKLVDQWGQINVDVIDTWVQIPLPISFNNKHLAYCTNKYRAFFSYAGCTEYGLGTIGISVHSIDDSTHYSTVNWESIGY